MSVDPDTVWVCVFCAPVCAVHVRVCTDASAVVCVDMSTTHGLATRDGP
jgi:hypothetical protein